MIPISTISSLLISTSPKNLISNSGGESGIYFTENFEIPTTGFENIWSTNIWQAGSSPTYSTTGLNMKGSQCLMIQENPSEHISSNSMQQLSGPNYVHLLFRLHSLPASDTNIIQLTLAILSTVAIIVLKPDGTMYINLAGSSATTSAISPDTTYHLWISWNVTNRRVTLAVSTTSTEPSGVFIDGWGDFEVSSISYYACTTVGNPTYYDQIIYSTSPITPP